MVHRRSRKPRRRGRVSSREGFWKKVALAAAAAVLAMGGFWLFRSERPFGDRQFLSTSDELEPSLDEGTEVRLYFGNSERDPQGLDCSRVFAVDRRIPTTPAIARAALELLLTGPTPEEQETGFYTSIPAGVAIRSLEIIDGTALVDFSDRIEEGVAGSCQVEAIRAQVEQTLRQFSTVRTVRISVGGRRRSALQP